LEVPPSGGSTSFCCMYSIYEALPAALKARIDGLKIKHDGTYNSGGYLRLGVTPTDDPRTSPGALHPLVCTHPDTGRRVLYLGRRRNAYIAGFDLAASEALLDELWSYAERAEFAWEHVWHVGDLVLWDNRCTMHRRDAFDPSARRIMHRTQIKATRDRGDWSARGPTSVPRCARNNERGIRCVELSRRSICDETPRPFGLWCCDAVRWRNRVTRPRSGQVSRPTH